MRMVVGPYSVKVEMVGEIFFDDRPVQRTYRPYVETRGLCKEVFDLRSVLADDADVISPRLVVALIFRIRGAEPAKRVCGKENAFGGIVTHHNLGPMYHGCG